MMTSTYEPRTRAPRSRNAFAGRPTARRSCLGSAPSERRAFSKSSSGRTPTVRSAISGAFGRFRQQNVSHGQDERTEPGYRARNNTHEEGPGENQEATSVQGDEARRDRSPPRPLYPRPARSHLSPAVDPPRGGARREERRRFRA